MLELWNLEGVWFLLEDFFWRLYFCMVKYWNFHNSFFAFKYYFIKWQGHNDTLKRWRSKVFNHYRIGDRNPFSIANHNGSNPSVTKDFLAFASINESVKLDINMTPNTKWVCHVNFNNLRPLDGNWMTTK